MAWCGVVWCGVEGREGKWRGGEYGAVFNREDVRLSRMSSVVLRYPSSRQSDDSDASKARVQ